MLGPFDYNIITLWLMRFSVLIHEKPNSRIAWDNQAVYGWYLQTSPDHYRAHVYRVKKTNAESVSDTVLFQYKHITNCTITHVDHIIRAIRNLEQSTKGLSNGKG